MSKRSLLFMCGLFLAACGPETRDDAPVAAAPAAAPEVAPTALPEPPAPPAGAPKSEPAPLPPGDGKVGVSECDGYAERYRSCIADKIPEDERDRHTRAVDGQLAAWIAGKADPAIAAGLVDECTAAAAAARAATRAWGCVWKEGDSEAPAPVRPPKSERSQPRGLLGPLD